MKVKKKTAALCGILAGALVFSTAAFADVKLGSGYDNFKTALKTTSAKMEKGYQNYTLEGNVSLVVDNKEIAYSKFTTKYDCVNKKTETKNETLDLYDGTKIVDHSFAEPGTHIYKDSDMDKYQVYHYQANESDYNMYTDVFTEEHTRDFEKVVDAFVGNLKDTVQTEDKNNKILYSGTLSDTQIPATINALTSFVVKYQFMENRPENSKIPAITENIYVKDVEGKALQGKDGALENVIGSATLVGNDENGKEHSITMNMVMSLRDINRTEITMPKLTAENSDVIDEKYNVEVLDQRYVGEYTDNVIEKDKDGFRKVGERRMVIDSVDEKGNFTGKYSETFTDDTKQKEAKSFAVSGHAAGDKERGDIVFTYEENGEKKNGNISFGGEYCENLLIDFDITYGKDNQSYSSGESYELLRVFK